MYYVYIIGNYSNIKENEIMNSAGQWIKMEKFSTHLGKSGLGRQTFVFSLKCLSELQIFVLCI